MSRYEEEEEEERADSRYTSDRFESFQRQHDMTPSMRRTTEMSHPQPIDSNNVTRPNVRRNPEAEMPQTPTISPDQIGQLLATMNTVLQQNTVLTNHMLENSRRPPANTMIDESTQNFHIMPDLSKTIRHFSGEHLEESKNWLENLKSTGKLHRWPNEILLETAKSHLVGPARQWYERRRDTTTTWSEFCEAFSNTFVQDINLTQLWTMMRARQQSPSEHVSTYFHNKIKLCSDLKLSFEETKEQIVIGLYNRELATMVAARYHLGEDALFRDLLSMSRILQERQEKKRPQFQAKDPNRTTEVPKVETTRESQVRLPARNAAVSNAKSMATSQNTAHQERVMT